MPVGSIVCSGTREALWCEPGPNLKAFACPGSNGCTTNANNSYAVCDWRGVPADSVCPAAQSGKGFCDGLKFFKCDGAQWRLTTCKTSCTTDDTTNTVTCR